MKLSAVSLAFASLCCICSADSFHDQLKSMNADVEKALLAKDINAFDKAMKPHVAANFKYIEDGRESNYQTMVAGMRAGVGAMSKVTVAAVKVLSVKVKGGTARVTGEHKLLGTMAGPDKKQHAMAYSGLSTEQYQLTSGKWLLVTMSMKTAKMTMDGKPMAAGAK
jgi:hypothetical protein